MVLYSRFLEEREAPSIWIFQGNPKYYDVINAVEDLDQITWSVNQYKQQIKKGDKAYIWLSGEGGGIVAYGEILENPEIRQPNLEDPYSQDENLNSQPYLAVDIRIDQKLISSRVERAILRADERTKKMEILTYPGATNFKVTKEEDLVIKDIINGNYSKVPAVALSDNEDEEKNLLLKRISSIKYTQKKIF
ncbi:EVE domain-containing protein [Planococcus sp. 107-1]|nr:EVE domain-containing protein [Planococcus sp. 107-1]